MNQNFFKKIFNDEKKLLDAFIILSGYNIVANIFLALIGKIFHLNFGYLNFVGIVSLLFAPILVYSILLRFNFAKKNFKIINVIFSWIFAFDILYLTYEAIRNILITGSLSYIIYFLISLVNISLGIILDLYWVLSFGLLPNMKKINFNNKAFFIAILSLIGTYLTMYLYYLTNGLIINLTHMLIITIPTCILNLCVARYIYLYQEHKERKWKVCLMN